MAAPRLVFALMALLAATATVQAKMGVAPVNTVKFMSSASLVYSSAPLPGTAKFPLHLGKTLDGSMFFYIVTEASTMEAATKWGVNFSPLLEHVINTSAVQPVAMDTDMHTLVYPHGVATFAPRSITPGAYGGFPPAAFSPGAVGSAGYTPLILLPTGEVLNAPIIATADSKGKITGQHNQATKFDRMTMPSSVEMVLRQGFANGKSVLYISTDASAELVATLEGATLAPALAMVPRIAQDDNIAFVNGQVGLRNPNRQGLNSTLINGLSPLNILGSTPDEGDSYTPIWRIFATAWTLGYDLRTRQMDADYVRSQLAPMRSVTNPDGTPLSSSGMIVVCSVVAQLLPPAFP